MKNTPKPQQSVQSQDLEITQNQNNNQQLEKGAHDAPLEAPESLGPLDPQAVPKQKGYPDGTSANGGTKVAKQNSTAVPPSVPFSPKSVPDVEPVGKEKTVSKSIRLWQSAFDALKGLMGLYGKSMVDMASIAIIAYAKKAAVAAIVRFRVLDEKLLFALQASATDIKTGLSNLRNDLYHARKSHRDPEQLKVAYDKLIALYRARMKSTDDTIARINKELTLYDLLGPSDHALLIQAIAGLKAAVPKGRSEAQFRDLYLRIFETLIR